MRRTGLLIAVVVCAVIVTACSGDGTSSKARAASAPLRGTNWILTDQGALGTPLAGIAVSAVFDKTQVTGSNGCNQYFASYTVSGSSMTIGPLGGTLIGCTGPAAAVERAYTARMAEVSGFAVDGKTLTLSSKGKAILVYHASIGAAALAGGWNVTSFSTGNAVQSPAPGSALTLEFAAERASGNSGCNTFDGPVALSGVDGIALGPFRSTLKACTDPALSAQEQQYLTALGLATTYRVTGDQLTLFRDGGTIAATFDRATGLTSGS